MTAVRVYEDASTRLPAVHCHHCHATSSLTYRDGMLECRDPKVCASRQDTR